MLVFYQVSYLQYALLLHLMFVFFLLPPFPLSQIPCFSHSHPHTSALPAYVLNKSHQHTLKYSSSVLLIYFGMQQTPKAPLPFFFIFIWLYLLRCHLKITSASFHSLVCLWGSGDLVKMEGSQQSVPFQGERDIEAILQ